LMHYMRTSKLDLTRRDIPFTAREFMLNKFGITIAHQLAFENYCDNLTVIQPLKHSSFDEYIPQVMRDFDNRYVKSVDTFCAARCNLQF